VVTYTDGTKTTLTQSLSDWFTPQGYSGETSVSSMAYRYVNGVQNAGPVYLYGYSFALNSAKTVASLTLPANTNVAVLAIDLTPAAVTAAATAPTFSLASGTYAGTQTVSLSDATSGAVIYYTTNGTQPTTASTLYTGPLTVSATTTIAAIAAATGYSNSGVASATYTITANPTAATPTFSLAAGAYTGTQTVSLGDGTSGAVIYYTTNGTQPTTASTQYTGPLTVSATTTIEAIAAATGYSNSSVASATYTIVTPTSATPTFSLAAGAYTGTQTVNLSDATPGAVIYYTTNGTQPTTASTQYTGPLTVSATTTIEAIAVATGYSNSAVASATYTIGSSQTPTPVSVSLTAIDDLYGIAASGAAITGGGLDAHGGAYASNLLGSTLTWNGSTFTFAAAGANSAVTNATITLPAGSYTVLNLLGTGVNGNQPNQSFVVTYTDGTTTTLTQSLSDWFTPQSYSGETSVLSTAYRYVYGVQQLGPVYLYGYSFALNSAKTVASLTLPANTNVGILAISVH
jgi:hypothetical protein